MTLILFPNLDTTEAFPLKAVEDTMVETIALCQRNSQNLNQQQREVGQYLLRHLKKRVLCGNLQLILFLLPSWQPEFNLFGL